MANTVVNPAIGKIVCPMAECNSVAEVKEFKPKADAKHKNRYSGKKYVVCSVHGTIGRDGNEALQKYIDENIQPLKSKTPPKKTTPPKSPPPKNPPKPAPEKKSDDSWGIL